MKYNGPIEFGPMLTFGDLLSAVGVVDPRTRIYIEGDLDEWYVYVDPNDGSICLTVEEPFEEEDDEDV